MKAADIAAWSAASVAVGAAVVQALAFPAFAWPLTALIVAAAAAVAWRPIWVLAILAAAMPVLDLAPLSGRQLVDEFDLLQLALLAVLWLRTRDRPAQPQPPPTTLAAFALLALSLGLALLRGGWPWPWPDANGWSSPHAPWNALRIGKGALWAFALIVLMRRLPGDEALRTRHFGLGICVGLGLTDAAVLWERAAFPGLFDFDADYRVTGPFSAMNTGGATIECFLAVGAAFAMAALLRSRHRGAQAVLALLLATTSYAMMVTYSRNGWGALLVAALLVAAIAARQRALPVRRGLAGAAVVLAMISAAVPVLLGGFAQQRLARTVDDFAVRLAHWRDALALRDRGALTAILGAGLGRFPALHRERSREPARAATFELGQDATGAFLRLRPGAQVYVEQIVDVAAGQRLELALSLRAGADPRVGIALCEKWLLTSAQCARIEPGPVRTIDGWQRRHWQLDTTGWAAARPGLARPVKLALFVVGDGDVDIARVQLAGADDRPLIANGDFSRGMDHWYFAADLDPPWHIHSLPVQVLFDQGWLGVAAWAAVAALALAAAARRAWHGDRVAAGALAALVAFAVSGSVNSLIDAPRVLWLGLMLLWLGANAALRAGASGPDKAPPPD